MQMRGLPLSMCGLLMRGQPMHEHRSLNLLIPSLPISSPSPSNLQRINLPL
jgi:hypothetical protein